MEALADAVLLSPIAAALTAVSGIVFPLPNATLALLELMVLLKPTAKLPPCSTRLLISVCEIVLLVPKA